MIYSYDEFLNEAQEERRSVASGSPMTPQLKKSLEEIGRGLKSEEDIIKAIEALGFVREPLKANSQSAEYIFKYAKDLESGEDYKYITYSNGYVRAIMPQGSFSRRHSRQPNRAPISDQLIPTTRERLLLVLRRALKRSSLYGMYKTWKKENPTSKNPVVEFLEKKRGTITGMKFGI
jgi:hypothetical protein